LHQPVCKADLLLVLGSRDDRVANYAAQLVRRSIAPRCLVSGGAAHSNDLLATAWLEETEAEHFANIMKDDEVDDELMLIEDRAVNTGENVRYSYELLKKAGIPIQAILIVTKPYMEKRALATFEAQWPSKETKFFVTSQAGPIKQYCDETQLYDDVVNIMVGGFQRIVEYPKHGLRTRQSITSEAQRAFAVLCGAGFTRHLIR